MENTLESYALALLTLMGNQEGANNDNPLLGMAFHLETQSSVFNLAAHELLRALIEHSPSPEAVAQQFMMELAQCENSIVIDLVHSLNNDNLKPIGPADWATAVLEDIKQNGGNLNPLTCLAQDYLNTLIIPFRNPLGKTGTPQDSEPSSPDHPERTEQIERLLYMATTGYNQAALKELVLRRDGHHCLISGFSFEGYGRIKPHCAHIIPFSIHDKPLVLTAIEMFTGNQVTADFIKEFINHPVNAINLETNVHDSMDDELAWGIEAKSVDNEFKYYFHAVKPASVPIFVRDNIQDGGEIKFRGGKDGDMVDLPNPELCNLQLAIARVFTASGFAEVVEKIERDDEGDSGIDFGDNLSCRLALLSMSSHQ